MANSSSELRIDGIPLVPATDLWEAKKAELSSDEVMTIALALYLTAPDTVQHTDEKKKWRVYSRARAVDRMVLAKRSG